MSTRSTQKYAQIKNSNLPEAFLLFFCVCAALQKISTQNIFQSKNTLARCRKKERWRPKSTRRTDATVWYSLVQYERRCSQTRACAWVKSGVSVAVFRVAVE